MAMNPKTIPPTIFQKRAGGNKISEICFTLAVSLWNNLDENTRTITNYESFKDTLMANINDNPIFHIDSR